MRKSDFCIHVCESAAADQPLCICYTDSAWFYDVIFIFTNIYPISKNKYGTTIAAADSPEQK